MTQTPSTDEQGRTPAGGSPKGPFGKIWLFLRQVIDELKKVVAPTRRELVNYTLVVLVFVVIVILLVTGLDWVFRNGAEMVFDRGGPEMEQPADAPQMPGGEDGAGELDMEDLEDLGVEIDEGEGAEGGEDAEGQ